MLDETLIPINDAPKRVPGRPSLRTIWRWAQRGVRGVMLETVVIGGRRYTSPQAIQRFIAGTTAKSVGDRCLPRAGASETRRRQIDKAERELDEAGI